MTTSEEMRREHEAHLRKLPLLQADTARLRDAQSAPAEILAAYDALGAWEERSHDIVRRRIEAAQAERD